MIGSLLDALPADRRNEAPVALRYEDVAQDGRLQLTPMTVGLGDVVWRGLLSHHAGARAMGERGIVPILSRLVLHGESDGPISVHHRVRARGGWWLASQRAASGAVERIYLNMALEVHGKIDVTHGPKPPGAGTDVVLGTVLAEHVFTRPFAPPGERKVLALALPDMPAVPDDAWRTPTTDEQLALPAGARWLEDAPSPSDATTFRLADTDGNLHVNSLVYPKRFELAVLARLESLGVAGVAGVAGLLARDLEVSWRKPSFAGETVRFSLRAFATDAGRFGATGTLVADGEPKPRATLRIVLAGIGR